VHLIYEKEFMPVHTQIRKLPWTYEQMALPFMIRPSFCKAELSLNTQTPPFKLEFNEEVQRQDDGFKELWDRNISVAGLSRRRRADRFGTLDAKFLDV
jgi:hypothetical protein